MMKLIDRSDKYHRVYDVLSDQGIKVGAVIRFSTGDWSILSAVCPDYPSGEYRTRNAAVNALLDAVYR